MNGTDTQVERIEYQSYLSHWLSVSYSLSLDIVVPLYEGMGLLGPFPIALAQVFRESMEETKRQGGMNQLIITRIKRRLREHFSEENVGRFIVWFSTVYCSNRSGWAEWRLFWEVKHSPDFKDKLKANCSIDERQISTLEAYIEYCFYWEQNEDDNLATVLKNLRKKSFDSLSEWDREFMQRNNYSLKAFDINDATEKVDLFVDAINTISMNRFQTGWENLWSQFSQEQKHKIVQACEQALNVGFKKEDLTDDILSIINYFPASRCNLPHPDTLIRYLY